MVVQRSIRGVMINAPGGTPRPRAAGRADGGVPDTSKAGTLPCARRPIFFDTCGIRDPGSPPEWVTGQAPPKRSIFGRCGCPQVRLGATGMPSVSIYRQPSRWRPVSRPHTSWPASHQPRRKAGPRGQPHQWALLVVTCHGLWSSARDTDLGGSGVTLDGEVRLIMPRANSV